jgi:outer membrane protein OmpA-like peptidoglycan-associated protein
MVELDSYRSNAAEAPRMRRWFIGALIFSLCLHLGLVMFFRSKELPRFNQGGDRLVPRMFSTKQVHIDPKLLNDTEADIPSPAKIEEPKKITLPEDPRAFTDELQEVRLAPSAPDIATPIVSDKPRVDAPKVEGLAALSVKTADQLDRELGNVSEQLLKDAASNTKRPLIKPGGGPATGNPALGNSARLSSAGETMPGFSSLDELLGQSGGKLKGGEKPIYMPGGALFEFDKYDVRPEAIDRLKKLARLIERNPGAHFSIEGHTDSFGTPEYNQQLSQARAEAIRAVLVTLGADPDNLTTRGFGSSRLIVKPDPDAGTTDADIQREVDRQAPNRRVEIVIQTKR